MMMSWLLLGHKIRIFVVAVLWMSGLCWWLMILNGQNYQQRTNACTRSVVKCRMYIHCAVIALEMKCVSCTHLRYALWLLWQWDSCALYCTYFAVWMPTSTTIKNLINNYMGPVVLSYVNSPVS